MNLTDGEILIIAMLCEIHEKLEIEDGIDPKFLKEAIFSGNSWGIKQRYQGLFGIDQIDRDLVSRVYEIMSMWSILERSLKSLSTEERDRVAQEAQPFGKSVVFEGFSGNDETDYMIVARFIVESMGQFREFDGRDFNSHWPSVTRYRRMLSAYKPLLESLSDGMLSADQIISILKEQVHPENRS